MPPPDLETKETHRCFGGTVGYHSHASAATGTAMRFSVFTPPQAAAGPVPVLIYLAGLTCDETTFMIKAGAQRLAADLGLMLVAPDTSPRGLEIDGIRDSWDFGEAAGFYLDATAAPWAAHFRMESYVTRDLPAVLAAHFPADLTRCGIMGHSMGGHGALTLGLNHPDLFRSISALAPIAAPAVVPWGRKALPRYLGDDPAAWRRHDTVALLTAGVGAAGPEILIDQGLADPFIDSQLRPDLLVAALKAAGRAHRYRAHAGYDHGYYFIETVIEDHLRHHAALLRA